MSSQDPGWYADPYQRHESRYWNGQAWSEHVGDHGQTFVDPPGERPPQAASMPAPTAAQPGGPAPTYAAPWAAPAATAQAAPRRRVTPIVLAGVVVVALVAGGVGLFIVNSSKPAQALTGDYVWKKRTTNPYWCVTDEARDEIEEAFPGAFTCTGRTSSLCKDCGNCTRLYEQWCAEHTN